MTRPLPVLEYPQTYTLTREEWLEINRALCGASLGLKGCWTSPRNTVERLQDRDERVQKVRDAMDILSTSYARAKKAMK